MIVLYHMLRRILILLLLPLMAVGCTTATTTNLPHDLWKVVANDIKVRVETVGDATIVLYRFPARGYRWRVIHNPQAKTVQEWSLALPRAVAVANGGYFREDYSPAGALVADGKRIGNRSFDHSRSAAVVLDDQPRIVDTKKTAFDLQRAKNAIQSYPLLIRDGKPALVEDSGLKARRTFIGTDTDDNVYLGVVPGETMTLFALSRALAAQDVKWQSVLNLDGGPSTGLIVHSGSYTDQYPSVAPVPNIIVVESIK